mmetsp:Transcript_35387/g.57324  ORF Transcript_35387/g.57324 Transcript_35387/m.57324 type:complete len:340 (+) Transcript_35387:195-1214(+)
MEGRNSRRRPSSYQNAWQNRSQFRRKRNYHRYDSNPALQDTLFVPGIPRGCEGGDLWVAFANTGEIIRAWVPSGQQYGFVKFKNPLSAQNAISCAQHGKGIIVSSSSRSSSSSSSSSSNKIRVYPKLSNRAVSLPDVFCDLDGVLCDFKALSSEILGKCVNAIQGRKDKEEIAWMWEKLENHEGFYEKLGWMKDGKQLWDAITQCSPTILSGVPRGDWADPQKRKWVAKHLDQKVKVITCFAPKKLYYCRRGSIIIDDSERLGIPWEQRGGIYVHHKNTKTTLETLKRIGLINPFLESEKETEQEIMPGMVKKDDEDEKGSYSLEATSFEENKVSSHKK